MLTLSADIVEKFYAFLWPMTRISAALMTAPLFATEASNARVRFILALVITMLVYPLIEWPRLDPLSAPGLIALLNQVAIGIVMGLRAGDFGNHGFVDGEPDGSDPRQRATAVAVFADHG